MIVETTLTLYWQKNRQAARMKFFKPSTRITPEVDINLKTGVFRLSGVSSPENSLKFYNPLINFFKKPLKNKVLTIELDLKHFNTSSSKCIYDLLKQSSQLSKRGIHMKYKWYYDEFDEDMLECGEDFADALNLDIDLIENQTKVASNM